MTRNPTLAATARKSRAPRYDGPENREAILRAALETFSRYGYEGSSTRMIAAAAGIEQGHLAYYFKSKESLWHDVIREFAYEGLALLRRDLTPQAMKEPVLAARSTLPALLRIFADNPQLTRIMLQEFSVNSPRHDWLVDDFGRPTWLALKPLFGALSQAGLLGGAPPEIAYFSMLGAALLMFGNPEDMLGITGVDPRDAGLRDIHIDLILAPIFMTASFPTA